jgi:hypothetical protein
MGWAREPGDAQGDERFRENVNERMPTCPGNSRTASKPKHRTNPQQRERTHGIRVRDSRSKVSSLRFRVWS